MKKSQSKIVAPLASASCEYLSCLLGWFGSQTVLSVWCQYLQQCISYFAFKRENKFSPGEYFIKLFFFANDATEIWARVFVSSKTFQSSLIFMGSGFMALHSVRFHYGPKILDYVEKSWYIETL
jgi:hypothetical protein